MKKNLIALAACATLTPAAWAAAPSSGAYVTDTQNTWVQDRVGDRINTVNMIMCIMGAMRSDAMVNKGAYLALVDQKKCAGRGDSGNSNNTSAGQSNATSFMNAVVESTQASTTAPLIMKAWITDDEDADRKMVIYVYSVATAGKSDAYPNGLFSIHYCGVPANALTGPCMMKGMLRSDANGLSFYEDESGEGGGGGETKLVLQSTGSDAGAGQMTGSDGGSPYGFRFAYDSSYFRRTDGTVDACFSRSKDAADYSTWRYGTYNADGSRLDSTNPGFPVKYVLNANTYYGFWSFWGLWLPDAALSSLGTSGTLTRRVGSDDVALTVVKKPGKLWKLTRQAATLDEFKNVPMMYFAQTTVGSGGSQLTQGNNYEVQWDGTHLLATGRQVCSGGDGCQPQAISPPIELAAADFRTAGAQMLPIFFPSGGGNGAIRVAAATEFAGTDVLAYRTRSLVVPGASDAPSSLVCLGSCPKSGSALTAAFGDSPSSPYLSQSWAPVVAGSATTYTYSSGILSDGGGDVDGSSISESSLGMFGGGITSGSLIAPSELSSVSCDSGGAPNPAGTHLCPGLGDMASVSYQWETGPRQWNQYFGAAGVTIDPPKSLSFDVTADNTRGVNKARYVGNTVQLQFSGFGELQGIPGNCVNPDTNAPVQCGPNTRYVPAFDMLDGAEVKEGSTSYYVKFLERELRLSQLTGGSETSCKAAVTLPTTLTLPEAGSLTVNLQTTLGTAPTLTSSKPAVIDGLVQ